jgi:hypothetical protein
MVAVVTNAIALTRPRVAAPRAARRRVTTAAASPNTSVSSAPSSVSNLMPRDRSTTQEIAQVAAKKASVAVPAKGSEPDAAARPFNFAGSAILAFLIGGGLTVFRVLKTKMDEREEALYKAKMEGCPGRCRGRRRRRALATATLEPTIQSSRRRWTQPRRKPRTRPRASERSSGAGSVK